MAASGLLYRAPAPPMCRRHLHYELQASNLRPQSHAPSVSPWQISALAILLHSPHQIASNSQG
uniref:Uncharacterized protein n=1 Tax=Zea mays TaxID=4577 RepID=B6SKH2_MAIZE|nr:hypothetical protein [Zea mays]ACG26467.1 hypothetical protein [Zea mays]